MPSLACGCAVGQAVEDAGVLVCDACGRLCDETVVAEDAPTNGAGGTQVQLERYDAA
jgi:hypothetical protein